MLWWRKTNKMPARPDGEPLRDGDTVPYPGYRRTAEIVADEPLPALPEWCKPTMVLPVLPNAPLPRPYIRRPQ